MTAPSEAIGNPWATIWTRPRSTIRRIVDIDVRYQVTFLAIISGALVWLERRWSNPSTAASFPMLVVLAVIAGAFAGVVELYVNGALLKWAGAALGGVGSYAELRAALAWSRVPVIVAVTIGLLAILFGTDGPILGDEGYSSNSSASILLVHGALVMWGFIVMLKCIGEVHRFSVWRALGSLVLVVVAIAVVIIGTMLLFGGIGRMIHPVVLV